MDEQCFYCHDTFKDYYHHGLFKHEDDYVDKPLCPECYQEWLMGMKG